MAKNIRKSLLILLSLIFLTAGGNAGKMKLKHPLNQELAKDLSSMVKESNFGSDCETSNYVITPECENYINFLGKSFGHWGPAILLTTYEGTFENQILPSYWRLSKLSRACHLVFVCAMFEKEEKMSGNLTVSPRENRSMSEETFEESPSPEGNNIIVLNPDFISIPKLLENFDHVLYFSNFQYEKENNMRLVESENRILNITGILLSVQLESQMENASDFRVYSRCKYCGRSYMNENLGVWRRNRNLFSDYMKAFEESEKVTFSGYKSFQIGYVEYPPHILCEGLKGARSNCSGIEWEMIHQIGRSLSFDFDLHNFTDRGQQGIVYSKDNITGMIGAIKDHELDIALGGISISQEKASLVDVTNIFTNQPIVFVVQKRTDLYILGIWLAFAPHVWPLIIFTILSVAVIIKLILWRSKHHRKRTYNPSALESIEMSVQPLLGQPISSSQLPKNPRKVLTLVLGIWWFSCLIISTVYNTNLITSLINPVSPKEPESLEDLFKLGYRFKVGSKQSAVSDLIFKSGANYKDRVSQQIHARLDDDEVRSRAPIAYILEESTVSGINWKEKFGHTNIRVIRERLFLTGYGWLLKKQAPYKRKINTAISRLSAAGAIQLWYEEYTKSENTKKTMDSRFRLRERIGQVKLNLELLQGAFIFLILGSALAGFVLGWEILRSKYTFRFFTPRELLGFSRVFINKVQAFNLREEVARAGVVGFILVEKFGNTNSTPETESKKEQPSQASKVDDIKEKVKTQGYYPFLK